MIEQRSDISGDPAVDDQQFPIYLTSAPGGASRLQTVCEFVFHGGSVPPAGLSAMARSASFPLSTPAPEECYVPPHRLKSSAAT